MIFKHTNGHGKYAKNKTTNFDYFRGMPFGVNSDGARIIASGRDIGNFIAGYMVAINGLPWEFARLAFDGYQSISNSTITSEGIQTQSAQRLGWETGDKNSWIKKWGNLIRLAPIIPIVLCDKLNIP